MAIAQWVPQETFEDFEAEETAKLNLGGNEVETEPIRIDRSRSEELNNYLGLNLDRIGEVKVAICGTGGTGSNVAESLVRNGVRNFLLLDNDKVDRSNLSGQKFNRRQIGNNKAIATAENLLAITSALNIQIDKDGVTHENIQQTVEENEVIYDCVDIEALDVIYELHTEALKQKKVVISTYDIGTVALTVTYRYDLAGDNALPLDGQVTQDHVDRFLKVKAAFNRGDITKRDFHLFLHGLYSGPVPLSLVPLEYLKIMVDKLGDYTVTDVRTYQLPETAAMLGGVSAIALKKLLGTVEAHKVKDGRVPLELNHSKYNMGGSHWEKLNWFGYLLKANKLLKEEPKLIEERVRRIDEERVRRMSFLQSRSKLQEQ